MVLLQTTIVFAQVTPIDSTHALITKNELKYITEIFIDYNFLKDVKTPGLEQQISIDNRIIADKDSIIFIKNNSLNLLLKENKSLRPSFWDGIKFWVGAIGGVCAGFYLIRL